MREREEREATPPLLSPTSPPLFFSSHQALTEPATDLKQLKAMAGIGKSSLAWISEFISTGDIAAAHEAKAPPPPAKEGHGALAFA